jgi:L-ornithine N5-monooxygenase
VAVEEMAPHDLASNTLVIEQHENVVWQRGMLLPWTQSQVSFLKDLVTRRNPCSRFSFVNYLHSVGRLDDFINMANFLPFRLEVSGYLSWVAQSLATVRVEYNRRCVGIDVLTAPGGEVTGWLVRLADGSTIGARNIVVGVGRDPHIPAAFAGLPKDRVIHSSQYALRTAHWDPAQPMRVAVIGAAQSAAEMLWETHQRLPLAQCTMIMRSVALNYYQTSPFTNELYFPSYVDEFFNASESARGQVLKEMRLTNYAGVTPDMLGVIYKQMYLERLTGTQRLRMATMVDVTDARVEGDDVVLTLADRKTELLDELRCDVVLLGTGFERSVPEVVRKAAGLVGVDEVKVNRAYRMVTPPGVTAGCYLQGTNETSHGVADSLMSVIATRAGEIVADLMAHRTANGKVTASILGQA